MRKSQTRAAVQVTATVQHIEKGQSLYRVRFQDLNGRSRAMLIPREAFRTPSKVCDLLLQAHADIPTNGKEATQIIIDAEKNRASRKIRLTNRTGWHGKAFVLPRKTYGGGANRPKFDDTQMINPALGKRKGKLKGWRTNLQQACELSDYLLFGIAVAFAAPLLCIMNSDEGVVFHLHGRSSVSNDAGVRTKSSNGKTLAARAAASTLGRCTKNDLMTFAVSSRGIEDLCFAHNDLVLVLDEEGRILHAPTTGRASVSEIAYAVPSGRGKVRSNRATRDRDLQNLTWRLFAISTGENPLDGRANGRREEGEQVRMIGIPVPPGVEGGIFNRIPAPRSKVVRVAAKAAESVEATIASHYGLAFSRFIKQLVLERKHARKLLKNTVAKFITKVGADSDAWNRRFATKFGIVLASALLSAEFGVVPWTAERAWLAVQEIYKRARASVASDAEIEAVLIAKMNTLLTDRDRLPFLKKGEAISNLRRSCAVGVIRDHIMAGKVALVRRSSLESLTMPGATKPEILQRLVERGIIVKSKDNKVTCQIMIKGFAEKKYRYVCFDVKKLRSAVT
jgi:hypothetical protein